jgi:hypothetical protein
MKNRVSYSARGMPGAVLDGTVVGMRSTRMWTLILGYKGQTIEVIHNPRLDEGMQRAEDILFAYAEGIWESEQRR